MEKVDPNNPAVRHAIWQSYNCKCFYCDEVISITELELDHIIPKSLKKQPIKLENILNQQGLPLDFELDSLLNLVPVSRKCNSKKSDTVLSETILALNLEKAKSKINLINKNIFKYKENVKRDNHLSFLKGAVKDNRISLEKIYNYISEEDDEFKEDIKLFEQEDTLIYKHYTKKIAFEATMPVFNNTEVNCILMFKTLKVRDSILLLDNKTILNKLFTGLDTDPIYGIRGFIEYKSFIKGKDEIALSKSMVLLGNNKVKLSENEIYDLCSIIDKFAESYLKKIKEIESMLKVQKFHLSKRKNGYKLLKLSQDLWLKLINFACKHDAENGNSNWHMFDSNRFYIKVFTNNSPKYSYGFHAFLYAELDEEYIYNPILTVNDLWVVWQPICNNILDFCIEKDWDAEYSYNWLVNDFIPKVIQTKSKSNCCVDNVKELTWGLKNHSTDVECPYYTENVNYISIDEIKTYRDLYDLVCKLQLFYNSHPNYKYRFSKDDIQGLYEVMLLFIEECDNVDLFYVSSKLRIKKEVNTNAELLKSIRYIREKTVDSTLNGFEIDLLMRCIIAMMDTDNKILDEVQTNLVLDRLSFIVNIYNKQILIEKYSVERPYY